MENNERRNAETMRDMLKKILPDLKLAYENAKILEFKYGWDAKCFEMCDAYMNLADAYICFMDALEEEGKGGGE